MLDGGGFLFTRLPFPSHAVAAAAPGAGFFTGGRLVKVRLHHRRATPSTLLIFLFAQTNRAHGSIPGKNHHREFDAGNTHFYRPGRQP